MEILRVLKRLALKINVNYTELEARFWDLCNAKTIRKEFEFPISESLIIEVRHSSEFRMIAKLLRMEVKDMPYLVAAFQFGAFIVTRDIKSILSRRAEIKRHLNIEIKSLEEFLEES